MVVMQAYSVSLIVFLIIECYLIGILVGLLNLYSYFKFKFKHDLYLAITSFIIPFLTLFDFKIGIVFLIIGFLLGSLINFFSKIKYFEEENKWEKDYQELNQET